MNKTIATCLLTIYLYGCTSNTVIDGNGRVISHHFGYVKIIKPPTFPENKTINVTGARLLGFNVGEGFTIGYKAHEYIQVPTDCRVLVVVKNSAQLEHMIKEMSLINEGEICATISPN